MRIESRIENELAVLHLAGDFDAPDAVSFLREIDALRTRGCARVLLNLRGLYFFGSRACAALREATARLEENGGEIALAEPSRLVARVLGTLEMPPEVGVFATESLAREALGRDRPAALARGATTG